MRRSIRFIRIFILAPILIPLLAGCSAKQVQTAEQLIVENAAVVSAQSGAALAASLTPAECKQVCTNLTTFTTPFCTRSQSGP
jgi:hypothetical protein